MKSYNGRIPACGVFCGGCPIYTREKSPCKGAEQNGSRCEKCKAVIYSRTQRYELTFKL